MNEPYASTTDQTPTDQTPTHQAHTGQPGTEQPGTGSGIPAPGAFVTRLADRRGVLRAGVAVAGVGVVAACSSPPVPSTPAGGGASSSAAAGDASSASSAATPSGGGTPTADVPVGGAKFYADSKTVVTQPTAGTFKAFDTTCPHQGCAVASVEGDQLVCPCHQSHFNLSTGDVVSGPAPTGLTPKTVTVEGSSFTVA